MLIIDFELFKLVRLFDKTMENVCSFDFIFECYPNIKFSSDLQKARGPRLALGPARWALAEPKPERPKPGPSPLKGGPGLGLHSRPGRPDGLARIMGF